MNDGKEFGPASGNPLIGSRSFRTHPADASPCFAAIDLGTNNCRLMIAARRNGGFRVIDSFNRTVRLGEGLQQTGRLNELAMSRTIAALQTCMARLKNWPVQSLRAVATEACRRAENGMEFLSRIYEETGLRIEVISAREEAELAVESCSALLHHAESDQSRALLFDIGGGSTEIAWLRLDPATRQQEVIGLLSIPLGVITMAECFPSPATAATNDEHVSYYENMVAFVTKQLRDFEAVHRIRREIEHDNVQILGTSGTITTLAGIALRLERYSRHAVDGLTLPSHEALNAISLLRSLGRQQLDLHPCVGPDRSGYVLPGCAIFEAIQRLWPVPDVIVADRGLRDGILLRLARGKIQNRSSRPSFLSCPAGRMNHYADNRGTWMANSTI